MMGLCFVDILYAIVFNGSDVPFFVAFDIIFSLYFGLFFFFRDLKNQYCENVCHDTVLHYPM